jgi:hypothetical protein
MGGSKLAVAIATVALITASCSADDPARASVSLADSVTAELRQDDDLLCVDLGKLGGFCGDKLSESSPMVHGTSTAGGPDSPLYVFGAVLDTVETFDVKVGDTTYTPELVPVGDDTFWDVRVWMVRVDRPSDATAEIVSVVMK